MGLLDDMLGNAAGSNQQQAQNPLTGLVSGLTGGNQQQSGKMLNAVLGLVQQMGGISGVLDLFQQHGMGRQADSWVSTGPNEEISGEDVQNVFGAGQVGNIASQLGMSGEQVSSGIAQLLPELINRLTPEGHVPGNQDDLISQAKSMLGGFLQ